MPEAVTEDYIRQKLQEQAAGLREIGIGSGEKSNNVAVQNTNALRAGEQAARDIYLKPREEWPDLQKIMQDQNRTQSVIFAQAVLNTTSSLNSNDKANAERTLYFMTNEGARPQGAASNKEFPLKNEQDIQAYLESGKIGITHPAYTELLTKAAEEAKRNPEPGLTTAQYKAFQDQVQKLSEEIQGPQKQYFEQQHMKNALDRQQVIDRTPPSITPTATKTPEEIDVAAKAIYKAAVDPAAKEQFNMKFTTWEAEDKRILSRRIQEIARSDYATALQALNPSKYEKYKGVITQQDRLQLQPEDLTAKEVAAIEQRNARMHTSIEKIVINVDNPAYKDVIRQAEETADAKPRETPGLTAQESQGFEHQLQEKKREAETSIARTLSEMGAEAPVRERHDRPRRKRDGPDV